jgi:predicted dehydrogenase
MTKVRGAIIGTGSVVEDLHLSALRGLPQVEIAAICDTDRARARRAQELAGAAKAYSSLDGLLNGEPNLDFVDIATPAHTHFQIVKQALEAGLHVLVEKPLALSATEGAELDALARRRQRKLCVLQTYRYRTPMLQVEEALAAGTLGTLNKMSTTVRVDGDPFVERRGWDWDEKRTRLLLYELAVHYVDLAVHFLGPLTKVLGFSAQRAPDSGDVTGISALMEHESGALSVLDFTVRASSRFIRVEFFGTKGDVNVKLFPEGFVAMAGTVNPLKEIKAEVRRTSSFIAQTLNDKLKLSTVKRRARSHFLVMEGFVRSIENEELDPPVTAASAVRTLEALDLLHELTAGTKRTQPVRDEEPVALVEAV